MRKLCNEYIITGEGIAQIDFNKMIVLNESAAYLWESFEDGSEFTEDDLAAKLVERYDIDMERAKNDSAVIARKWIEAGIAE